MKEIYKNAFGWHVRKTNPNSPDRWLYVSKVHKDNTVEWSQDHLYAKDLSEKTAKKLLELIKEG